MKYWFEGGSEEKNRSESYIELTVHVSAFHLHTIGYPSAYMFCG